MDNLRISHRWKILSASDGSEQCDECRLVKRPIMKTNMTFHHTRFTFSLFGIKIYKGKYNGKIINCHQIKSKHEEYESLRSQGAYLDGK